ncbi:MAG TPA: DUF3943 domain-containing protein [Candidatus Cloacimonadota bacterium]|nr:DUF3943 domain-containing protein [Candidatus Cloacimonadota bacterium]
MKKSDILIWILLVLLVVPLTAIEIPISIQQEEIFTKSDKHYDRAALEIAGCIGGLWSYDRYITRQKWAVIGCKSIEANFKHGFEWDRGEFGMNQILHPYNGSMYYTAARSNHLSFAESSGYTFLGSLTWELFMENHFPSANDMIMTTLGGVALGEVLYRLADLNLNVAVSPALHTSKELLSAVISPMYGFNRLINRPKRGAQYASADLDLTVMLGGNSEQISQYYDKLQPHIMAGISLEYNELFQDNQVRTPFDYFKLDLSVMAYRDNTIPYINLLGHLVGREFSTEHFDILGGSFLQYDFTNNKIIKFSTTSIGPGIEIRSKGNDDYEIKFGTHIQGIALGAISSPYHVARMDYNLGPGFAISNTLQIGKRNGIKISLRGSHYQVFNVQGADGHETISLASSSLDIPVYRSLSYSLNYVVYHRKDFYHDYSDLMLYSDTLQTYFTFSL